MKKTGAQLIADERQRQQTEEGFNNDEQYHNNELVRAAVSYCMPQEALTESGDWPWSDDWFKSEGDTKEGRIKDLTKAGALIAAEIDRLQKEQG